MFREFFVFKVKPKIGGDLLHIPIANRQVFYFLNQNDVMCPANFLQLVVNYLFLIGKRIVA